MDVGNRCVVQINIRDFHISAREIIIFVLKRARDARSDSSSIGQMKFVSTDESDFVFLVGPNRREPR